MLSARSKKRSSSSCPRAESCSGACRARSAARRPAARAAAGRACPAPSRRRESECGRPLTLKSRPPLRRQLGRDLADAELQTSPIGDACRRRERRASRSYSVGLPHLRGPPEPRIRHVKLRETGRRERDDARVVRRERDRSAERRSCRCAPISVRRHRASRVRVASARPTPSGRRSARRRVDVAHDVRAPHRDIARSSSATPAARGPCSCRAATDSSRPTSTQIRRLGAKTSTASTFGPLRETVGDVELEEPVRARDLARVGDPPAVQPDVRAVVQAVEMQRDVAGPHRSRHAKLVRYHHGTPNGLRRASRRRSSRRSDTSSRESSAGSSRRTDRDRLVRDERPTTVDGTVVAIPVRRLEGATSRSSRRPCPTCADDWMRQSSCNMRRSLRCASGRPRTSDSASTTATATIASSCGLRAERPLLRCATTISRKATHAERPARRG